MKSILLLFLWILLGSATCKDKEEQTQICTAQFVSIGLEVKNSQDDPAVLESFKVTRLSDQKDLTVKFDPADLDVMQQIGMYPITNDSFREQLAFKNVEVLFTGTVEGKTVLSQKFVISADACHVVLKSGPREVKLP